jgi:formylglycine-generating enzyme required for sulfatase activity
MKSTPAVSYSNAKPASLALIVLLLVGCGGTRATPIALPTEAALGDTWTRPADGMVMVYVPGGIFPMGSDGSDPGADTDEFPQHSVTLDGFWIDRTKVTNRQFAAFLDQKDSREEGGKTWLELDDETCLIEGVDGKFRPRSGYADHPVIEVSWYGVVAYCEWAGGRLPTEAEWEYAARGSDGRIYPWGNDAPTCEQAQFAGCEGDTVPVDSRPEGASWCGTLDMAGNVWEWVNDRYDRDYYGRSPLENPTGPETGNYRVLRGGSFYFDESYARAASRNAYYPVTRYEDFGFRCARSEE